MALAVSGIAMGRIPPDGSAAEAEHDSLRALKVFYERAIRESNPSLTVTDPVSGLGITLSFVADFNTHVETPTTHDAKIDLFAVGHLHNSGITFVDWEDPQESNSS